MHFESLDFFIDIGIIIEIIVNSFSHCITLLVFLVFIEWNIFLWSLGNRNLWKVCLICVHMPLSGLSSLVQFLYMPATVRRPVC